MWKEDWSSNRGPVCVRVIEMSVLKSWVFHPFFFTMKLGSLLPLEADLVHEDVACLEMSGMGVNCQHL